VAVIPTGLEYTQAHPWHATLRFGSPLWRADFATSAHFVQAVEQHVHELSGVHPAHDHATTSIGDDE